MTAEEKSEVIMLDTELQIDDENKVVNGKSNQKEHDN